MTREALDPNSGLHVLPDQDQPRYTTDPPTSGAHYSLPPPTGVQDDPIERPMQVTALEGGQVLVQYRDLAAADVAALEDLASDVVVVAPNPDQVEPVVLTAWITKQTCSGVDWTRWRPSSTSKRVGAPGPISDGLGHHDDDHGQAAAEGDPHQGDARGR